MKNFFYWLPRVLAVLFICFVSLFSLDVFSMEGTAIEKLVGFLMHSIPAILLIICLVLAWKKEKEGGIAFVILAVAFTLFFKTYQSWETFLLLSLPILLIGLIFLFRKK